MTKTQTQIGQTVQKVLRSAAASQANKTRRSSKQAAKAMPSKTRSR